MQETCSLQAGGFLLICVSEQRAQLCFTGKELWQILEAGEWRSPAFLAYMDLNRLDEDLVLRSHMDEETDEDVAV